LGNPGLWFDIGLGKMDLKQQRELLREGRNKRKCVAYLAAQFTAACAKRHCILLLPVPATVCELNNHFNCHSGAGCGWIGRRRRRRRRKRGGPLIPSDMYKRHALGNLQHAACDKGRGCDGGLQLQLQVEETRHTVS